eukprot:g5038.t1
MKLWAQCEHEMMLHIAEDADVFFSNAGDKKRIRAARKERMKKNIVETASANAGADAGAGASESAGESVSDTVQRVASGFASNMAKVLGLGASASADAGGAGGGGTGAGAGVSVSGASTGTGSGAGASAGAGSDVQASSYAVRGLNVTLRPYQSESVEYMVAEESSARGFHDQLYAEVKLASGTTTYFSPALASWRLRPPPIFRGGFLAEEMGLGKTVETVALILRRPRPAVDDAAVVAAAGAGAGGGAGSKYMTNPAADPADPLARHQAGTLVVCTPSLVGQWIKEIRDKLAQLEDGSCPLSIYCYHGPGRKKLASELMKHDVVVTTYRIVESEHRLLDKEAKNYVLKTGWKCALCNQIQPAHADACQTKSARAPFQCRGLRKDAIQRMLSSKFCPPMEGVEWHRIVLDESHYIKNPAAKWSQATLRLHGASRWCVTGTPIHTTTADLYNQMKFIGIQPFDNVAAWTQTDRQLMRVQFDYQRSDKRGGGGIRARHPVHRLRAALRATTLRHTMAQKRNGMALLALPPKLVEVVKIDFRASEKKAYKEIHAQVNKRLTALKTRYPHEMHRHMFQVMALLQPLRMACSGGASMRQASVAGANRLGGIADDMSAGAGVSASASASAAASTTAGNVYTERLSECSICMEMLEDPKVTPCGHMFCKDCIETVLTTPGASFEKCPNCRTRCTPAVLKNPPPAPTEACEEEEGDHAAETNGGGGVLEVEMDSKCKALLQKLKDIREEDQAAKALVFSHFQATIEWLKKKLVAAGFKYRSLDGAMSLSQRSKALRDFQDDPPTTIFLMSIRSGACGINLTQANHVFLLEPCLNPALEKQAIGRVHRMGQKRRVKVWKMHDSSTIKLNELEFLLS